MLGSFPGLEIVIKTVAICKTNRAIASAVYA
jgi:hypothetical protein